MLNADRVSHPLISFLGIEELSTISEFLLDCSLSRSSEEVKNEETVGVRPIACIARLA